MKKFLALYIGSASEQTKSKPLSDEQQKTLMNDWMNWAMTNHGAITDQGSPLGKTLKASAEGTGSAKNSITGYVIVQAKSHEEATKMFIEHPHVKLLQGNSVEVIECLSIPEMPK